MITFFKPDGSHLGGYSEYPDYDWDWQDYYSSAHEYLRRNGIDMDSLPFASIMTIWDKATNKEISWPIGISIKWNKPNGG